MRIRSVVRNRSLRQHENRLTPSTASMRRNAKSQAKAQRLGEPSVFLSVCRLPFGSFLSSMRHSLELGLSTAFCAVTQHFSITFYRAKRSRAPSPRPRLCLCLLLALCVLLRRFASAGVPDICLCTDKHRQGASKNTLCDVKTFRRSDYRPSEEQIALRSTFAMETSAEIQFARTCKAKIAFENARGTKARAHICAYEAHNQKPR